MLEPHADRVTWDAIIHSVEDIEALRWPPRTVNVKPSRFGTIERLFATYEYCEENGIGAYGGGQWELSSGAIRSSCSRRCSIRTRRTTSLPADTTPRRLPPGLPASPLVVRPRETGFAVQS